MAISRKGTVDEYRPTLQFLINQFLSARFPGITPLDIASVRIGSDASTIEFYLDASTSVVHPPSDTQRTRQIFGILSKEQIGNVIRVIDPTVADEDIIGASLTVDDTARASFFIKTKYSTL